MKEAPEMDLEKNKDKIEELYEKVLRERYFVHTYEDSKTVEMIEDYIEEA